MFLSVDNNACSRCGLCSLECPLGLIVPDKDGVPAAVGNAADYCIGCGHCVSVCPSSALSLEAINVRDCAPLAKGWELTPGQAEGLLKGRRSIRTFKPETVEREKLEKLVDIARYAPSGVNRRPLRWTVLSGKEKVAAVAGAVIAWMEGLVSRQEPISQSLRMDGLIRAHKSGRDFICRKAPNLVFTYALKDDMMAAQASTIALTYLDCAAPSLGLGACWAGYAHMAINASHECRALVGLNARCACFGAMLVGYPAVSYCRIPPRAKPKINFR